MMKYASQKILWVGLIIAIILGGLWQYFPLPDAKERLEQLPMHGTHFNGTEAPLSQFEKDFFKKINILKRVYKVENQSAFIYVLDGTHNRHLVHDPFYCFRGAGWDTVSQQVFLIPGGDANLVRLSKSGQFKDTLYWFSDGKSRYMSPLRYWWQTSLRRLTFGWSGKEPVLIVVQPLETESLNWKKLEDDFPELFAL